MHPGLPTSDVASESKTAYVIDMIKHAQDDDLVNLHTYLVAEAGGSRPAGHGPWTGDRLRVFCSHLEVQKETVGQVREQLSYFGVEAFVAHDSIDPSREWIQVIQNALANCDAMIVFLHDGFRDSAWCDQEVGWALGRQRPDPAARLRNQPLRLPGAVPGPEVRARHDDTGHQLHHGLADEDAVLHARLAHGLVDALVESRSWDFTRRVAPLLERMTAITNDDLTRMEKAAQDNVEVRDCMVPTAQPAVEVAGATQQFALQWLPDQTGLFTR